MESIDEEVKKAKEEEAQAELKEAFAKKTQAELKESIAKNVCARSCPMVTIELEEYLALRELERDYGRLMRVIQDNADLNYSGEEVRTSGDEIMKAIKLLDPVFYEDLLRTLKEKENE